MFKEIKSLIKYLKLSEDKKRIVFYSEIKDYYSYYEGVIEQLTKTHDVTYITSDAGDPLLSDAPENLHVFYLKRLAPVVFKNINCSVFVMTLTDLGNYYFQRSLQPVHYVYMFHSMVSTHMAYSEKAFDNYDSILCVGDYQIEEIKKREEELGLKPKNLISTGYYRLERIHLNYSNQKNENNASDQTILIAPSWGEDNILERMGEELIGELEKSGYRIIVRPHPETRKRNPVLIKRLSSLYETSVKVSFDSSVSTDESLFKADLLVCDLSGVALEYSLGTERPTLFLDGPIKIKNQKYQDLEIEPFELKLRSEVGQLLRANSVGEVIAKIKELLGESEEYGSKIRALREQNIAYFSESSKKSSEYIKSLLN